MCSRLYNECFGARMAGGGRPAPTAGPRRCSSPAGAHRPCALGSCWQAAALQRSGRPPEGPDTPTLPPSALRPLAHTKQTCWRPCSTRWWRCPRSCTTCTGARGPQCWVPSRRAGTGLCGAGGRALGRTQPRLARARLLCAPAPARRRLLALQARLAKMQADADHTLADVMPLQVCLHAGWCPAGPDVLTVRARCLSACATCEPWGRGVRVLPQPQIRPRSVIAPRPALHVPPGPRRRRWTKSTRSGEAAGAPRAGPPRPPAQAEPAPVQSPDCAAAGPSLALPAASASCTPLPSATPPASLSKGGSFASGTTNIAPGENACNEVRGGRLRLRRGAGPGLGAGRRQPELGEARASPGAALRRRCPPGAQPLLRDPGRLRAAGGGREPGDEGGRAGGSGRVAGWVGGCVWLVGLASGHRATRLVHRARARAVAVGRVRPPALSQLVSPPCPTQPNPPLFCRRACTVAVGRVRPPALHCWSAHHAPPHPTHRSPLFCRRACTTACAASRTGCAA